MTDQEIRDRLIVLETESKHRSKQLDAMQSILERVDKFMVEQETKEKLVVVHHQEGRENSWERNAWVRAFIPTGILVGAWTAIGAFARWIYNGGTAP